MTGDESLIDRMRWILYQREGCSERRMFGTVGFMIHGNMCAGAWKGSLIVRLDKKEHDAGRAVHWPADKNGRAMKGWGWSSRRVLHRPTSLYGSTEPRGSLVPFRPRRAP